MVFDVIGSKQSHKKGKIMKCSSAILAVAVLLCGLSFSPAQASGAGTHRKAAASSATTWQLKISKDPMTDKVSSEAHFVNTNYGVGFGIQKGNVVMYFMVINVQKYGLLDPNLTIAFRVDSNPAHEFSKGPTQYIWSPKMVLGVVGETGSQAATSTIQQLTHGKTLKVRFYTTDGAVDIEVPLAGACVPLSHALGVSASTCPKG